MSARLEDQFWFERRQGIQFDRTSRKKKFWTLGKTSADNGNVIEVKQDVRSQHDNTAELL